MPHLIESGEGRFRVYLDLIEAGSDLVLYIGGGDSPHVGSISICTREGEPITLSLPGHKDYLVSHTAAQIIFKESARKTVVISGIHVEKASKKDIAILLKNADDCIQKFKMQLKEKPL
ncbi:MAG: hypothetical protein ACP5KV_01745 [Candidatus Methanomethylicaceae archaeon]